MFTICGSPAVDIGGVVQDKINRVFEFLLNSDIFILDHVISQKTFKEFPFMGYHSQRKKYIAMGLIFYWFVLIHHYYNPFLVQLNPAILAYGIHSCIPQNVVQQVNSHFGHIADTIEQYTLQSQVADISPRS